jgi:hypothetical protein
LCPDLQSVGTHCWALGHDASYHRATSSLLEKCRTLSRKKPSHENEMLAEKLDSFATLAMTHQHLSESSWRTILGPIARPRKPVIETPAGESPGRPPHISYPEGGGGRSSNRRNDLHVSNCQMEAPLSEPLRTPLREVKLLYWISQDPRIDQPTEMMISDDLVVMGSWSQKISPPQSGKFGDRTRHEDH